MAWVLAAFSVAASLGAGNPQSKPVREEAASSQQAPAGRVESRKNTRITITVNGHVMRPGADLRGVHFRGADLRWVDLRGANLAQADLTGARLCGSNLSRANLSGTILTGADLADTILFEAYTFGAVGADFSRAHLHPFFNEERAEAEGAVRMFIGLRRPGNDEPIRNVLVSPRGNLYWLRGDQGSLGHLAATGALYGFSADNPRISEVLKSRQFSMVVDGNNQLILVGERWFTFFDLEASEGTKILPPGLSPFRSTSNRIPGAQTPPLQAFRSPWGSVMLSWPDSLLDFHRQANGTTNLSKGPPIPGFRSGPLVVSKGTGQLYYLDEDNHLLVGLELKGVESFGAIVKFPLPQATRPDLLVLGGDGRIWAARRGDSRVFAYSVNKGASAGPEEYALPQGAHLYQMASGPDGNLWITDPAGDRLYRLTPQGVPTAFPLPEGTEPADILDYRNGRLLFTSLGGDRIGSIRAVASPNRAVSQSSASAASQSSASAASQSSASAASSPAAQVDLGDAPGEFSANDLEQLEAHMGQPLEHHLVELREEATETGRVPLPAMEAGASSQPASSSSAPPAEPVAASLREVDKDAPRPAQGRPARLLLAERGVLLTKGAIRHILARHQASQKAAGSEFNAALSEPGALSELIASGLLQAERHGMLGRVRMWDRRERGYTLCSSRDWVGTYLNRGQATPTRTFLVVTGEYYDPQTRGRVQGVVTAYPVAPTW